MACTLCDLDTILPKNALNSCHAQPTALPPLPTILPSTPSRLWAITPIILPTPINLNLTLLLPRLPRKHINRSTTIRHALNRKKLTQLPIRRPLNRKAVTIRLNFLRLRTQKSQPQHLTQRARMK
ncbi:hypothetical protein P154DRAFT_360339 [Amniculicola lignicola CBS 123094]|uniref:Uncharacterized protein n=1 Tax=Amniculicola lignicola CBS 123094 TaxID=1392246 RepID=A0A6A5W212_9PLEO|nr:hypothetical protein P154DRAFT_360339 [Amniculicola lignicola CBS 123094]